MGTRTQYKLEEARFFLDHVEKHWRDIPHVDFYLSAFVSAARKRQLGHAVRVLPCSWVEKMVRRNGTLKRDS